MSIARAFTVVRRKKSESVDITATTTAGLQRNSTNKLAHGTIKRQGISAPLELVSTTNMLSYNAPDIYPKSAGSRSSLSSSSRSSHDDSTKSPGEATPLSTPDTSSIDSPSPTSLEPNHLSCYFGGAAAVASQTGASDEAPSIPQRAPSHTKKSHEILSRSRSIAKVSTRISNSSSMRSNSISSNGMARARSSFNMFSPTLEDAESHPFGHELAQVTEIAEEYGLTQERMEVLDAEEQEMKSMGLFKFCAEDYLTEIHGLFQTAFGDTRPSMAAMWI